MKPPRVTSAARFRRLAPSASWLGFLVMVLAGCGGDRGADPATTTPYPVQGQVLLADGKPLKGGKIVFAPKELGRHPAAGAIGTDGSFSLKTDDGRDGAEAGDYKVRIEPTAELFGKSKGGLADPNSLPFPAKYADIDGDTGLTATVKPEPNKLEPFRLVKESRRGIR